MNDVISKRVLGVLCHTLVESQPGYYGRRRSTHIMGTGLVSFKLDSTVLNIKQFLLNEYTIFLLKTFTG